MDDREVLAREMASAVGLFTVGDSPWPYPAELVSGCLLPMVEKYVSRRLVEQREAIATAFESGIPMHTTPAGFVRDFGDEEF